MVVRGVPLFKASAPELPKAGGSKAAFPDNFSASGWEVKSVLCPALKRSKKNKTLGFPKDFVAELVPPPGLEPGASGLVDLFQTIGAVFLAGSDRGGIAEREKPTSFPLAMSKTSPKTKGRREEKAGITRQREKVHKKQAR